MTTNLEERAREFLCMYLDMLDGLGTTKVNRDVHYAKLTDLLTRVQAEVRQQAQQEMRDMGFQHPKDVAEAILSTAQRARLECDKSLRECLEEQFHIEGWNVKIGREEGLIHAIVYAVTGILEQLIAKARLAALEEVAQWLEANHRDDDGQWEACCNLPEKIRALAQAAAPATKEE